MRLLPEKKVESPAVEPEPGLTGVPADVNFGIPFSGPTGSTGPIDAGPTGPRRATGPTGPAPVYVLRDAPKGVAAVFLGATGPGPYPGVTHLNDGEWYAFRIEGREAFYRVRHDLTAGSLELSEIDDPYQGSPTPGELRALTDEESQRLADSEILEDF